MAQNLVVNGVTFLCPQQGDQNWAGANGADGWMAAVTVGMLQKAGGAFTLTADVNFGSSFGLVSPYFKSASANIAGAGAVRLANADSISFRNVGNTADQLLAPGADGILQYAGINLVNLSTAQVLSNKTLASPTVTGTLGATGTISTTSTAANSTTPSSNAIYSAGGIGAASTITAGSSIYSGKAGAGGNFRSINDAGAANWLAGILGTVSNTSYSIYDLINSQERMRIDGTTGQPAFSYLASAGVVLNDSSGNLSSIPTLPVTKGGTGLASATAYAVLCGGTTTTGAFQSVAALGSAGQALCSNGPGALPTFQSVTPTFTGLTANGVAYASSTAALATAAAGTSGQVMTSNGSGSAPTMQTLPGNATALKAPTVTKLTSTGATTGYLFTVTSANATVGATYTNNGSTYTVLATIAAGTQLFCSQAAAPTASGTLTKASGTGDATITFSAQTPLATYTTPSGPGPLYLKVRLVGGGGGGAGTGAAAGVGGVTAFGANLLIAGGGGIGNFNGGSGTGGTVSVGAGATSVASIVGAVGTGSGVSNAVANVFFAGSPGASTYFGGGGGGGNANGSTGASAPANSGAGGGGVGAVGGGTAGGGGSAGGFIEAIITSPAATFVYCIGAGGTAGASGGGAGGSGFLTLEERYQ